jgi:hypothetical protein
MVDPLTAATLPVAPPGALAGAAAPALDAMAPAATSAVAPVPRMRAQRPQRMWGPVDVFMVVLPLSVVLCGCERRCGKRMA